MNTVRKISEIDWSIPVPVFKSYLPYVIGARGVYLRFSLGVQEGAFNSLSPNGDQYQFSPNDIHRLSRD